MDELQSGWHSIIRTLSRFRPEHANSDVILGEGKTVSLTEFLRMSAHTSRHAGQLVPASRARRWRSA